MTIPDEKYAAEREWERLLIGGGGKGFRDGVLGVAKMRCPRNIFLEPDGHVLVVDGFSIRRVSPSGEIHTIAGNEDMGHVNGPVSMALFDNPYGIAKDRQGNIYVSDSSLALIRKISPDGLVSDYAGSDREGWADGPSDVAEFAYPRGLCLDVAQNLYVADMENQLIRKITPDGTVSTIAGTGYFGGKDGAALEAEFSYPVGLAIDAEGNLYISEAHGFRIRKLSPDGMVSTVAGSGVCGQVDGEALSAQFEQLSGLSISPGGTLFVADAGTIRMVTPDGWVKTVLSDINAMGVSAESEVSVITADVFKGTLVRGLK